MSQRLPSVKRFLDSFEPFFIAFKDAMIQRYDEKYVDYNESWKSMPLWELQDRLREQMDEWQLTPKLRYEVNHVDDLKEARKKLVDVANLCWMVWTRMETEKEKVKTK